MARLGDYIQEEIHPLGEDGGTGLNMIGVSNARGLEISARRTSGNLTRYLEVRRGWFAYNPMRINVGSIGLADDDSKTGYTSPDYTVFSCKEGLLPEYLLRFLKSNYGLEEISRHTSGAVRKRLYFSGLSEIELKIPSVEQQSHLIAKFQNAEKAARSIHEENSDEIEIPLLKQAILQEAMQGKLTAEWRSANQDVQPASELLRLIQTERNRLIDEKKIRKEKAVPEVTPEEIPFGIPDGWEWCRFGNVQLFSDAGSSPKCKERPVRGDEWGILKVSATSGTHFKEEENKFYQSRPPDNIDAIVRIGDFILSRANTKELAGSSVIVDILTKRLLLSDKTVRFHFLRANLDPRYANLVNKAAFVREHFIGHATGASPSMKNLSRVSIKNHLFPLPPLAEQTAIVERVDALMATCRKLETEIEQSRTHAADLLQAILSEAFHTRASIERKRHLVKNNDHMTTSNQKKVEKGSAQTSPLSCTLKTFALRSFKMASGYRSLDDLDCEFHYDVELPAEAAPICLVGLNGAGKSNLIEAIADVFCFLELINLPWKSLKSASSKYRQNNHKFEISYTVEDASGMRLILIRKTKKTGADFFDVSEDGEESPIVDLRDRLSVLPRRVIGYSSGLNETVSHTFLRTRTLYSQEVRDAAPADGEPLSQSGEVFDTRTLYMDYESNAEILLCNYIFRKPKELEFIKRFTRVAGISSFDLRFNRSIAGKQGRFSTARITVELSTYLEKFARCAGQEYNAEQLEHRFSYKLNAKTKKLFIKEFGTAENLFLAMYKWSLLNALVLSDDQRKAFLKDDITKGTLERPPVVPPKSRIFDVADMKVTLSEPDIVIDYSGLSDGEHQFVQVFGTVLLFNEPGTLFLFDEPESHFNPEWRTQFNSILNSTPNAATHEYIISTHSPYIVSGSRGENVYKFERNGSTVSCEQLDFETYGASFDDLLKKLFSIRSLIDVGAKDELSEILKRGELEEMESAVGEFAESREKRRLYEAILKKQQTNA